MAWSADMVSTWVRFPTRYASHGTFASPQRFNLMVLIFAEGEWRKSFRARKSFIILNNLQQVVQVLQECRWGENHRAGNEAALPLQSSRGATASQDLDSLVQK